MFSAVPGVDEAGVVVPVLVQGPHTRFGGTGRRTEAAEERAGAELAAASVTERRRLPELAAIAGGEAVGASYRS